MPKVSVIVPVYKAEGFLRRCVESVQSQSFSDWELLLIEDGSPDGSAALCDAIAAEDSCVRVFHKPNGGVSSARNVGLDAAKGQDIAFLDSDDWFLDGMLETLVTLAEENGADSAGCAHLNVEESGASWAEPGVNPGWSATAGTSPTPAGRKSTPCLPARRSCWQPPEVCPRLPAISMACSTMPI